jgi:hypothetical protein
LEQLRRALLKEVEEKEEMEEEKKEREQWYKPRYPH